MKITLINPPQAFAGSQLDTGVIPPLSIMYLSSYLKQYNIKVILIDSVVENPDNVFEVENGYFGRGLSFEEILRKIPDDTELIGITNLFSVAFPLVLNLTAFIKKNMDKPIVVGGTHVSVTVKETLQDKNIDFVVIGEGEYTMLRLCKAVSRKKGFEKIDGLGYKKDGNIIVNPKNNFIKNIDELPFPDRESVDQDKYFEINESHGASQEKWTPILTSRGCPYSCTFCTPHERWRARSPKNVVDEIEHCIKKHGIEEFHFEDENLTLDKKRIINICDEITKRKLKIRWQTPNGIRASVTDKQILQKMKESGCYHITIAPESGSEFVLKNIMNKQQDLEKVIEVVKDAVKLKLKIATFFMMGLPDERIEDVMKTIRFAGKLARIGLDESYFGYFVPLPESELYKKLKTEGLLPESYKDFVIEGRFGKIVSYSKFISNKRLSLLNMTAYLWFYFNRVIFHPVKMGSSFINIVSGKQTMKTERAVIVIIKRLKKRVFRRTNLIQKIPIRFKLSFLNKLELMRSKLKKFILYKFKDIPLFVGIEINSICNRHCYYCPRDEGRTDIITKETFVLLLNQLKKWGFKGWVIPSLYNEPLLDKRIFDLLSLIKQMGFKVRLYSNGDFLDEYKVELLKQIEVDDIQITIHEPTNKEQVKKLVYLSKKYSRIRLLDFRDIHRRISLSNRGGYIKSPIIYKTNMCIMTNTLQIRSNGNVILCCHDIKGKYVFGNIYINNIQEIWDNPNFSNLRRKLRKKIFELDICKKCGYLGFSKNGKRTIIQRMER